MVTALRILVIDDSRTALKAAELALAPHEVKSISKFIDLQPALTEFQPQVVVLDLEMPGFRGKHFARFIQRYCEEPPPIVLHTSRPEAVMRPKQIELGCAAAVSKSSSGATLRAAVERVHRGG